MTDTVPTDWETKTLGEVCSLIMGQSPESESVNGDGVGYPFFQGNADFGRKYPDVRQWCIDPKKLSPSGGILVSVRAPVGEINTANQECCIGRGLGAIIPEKIVANFIYQYMFLARKDLVAVSQGSTFQAINKDDLKDLSIPCPPLGEQEKIADILTSVDDTIEHTEAQVAKLQDLKTATMNELLTRGIGHTEFRESELGLIPTTWEIKELGEITEKIASGVTPRGGSSVYIEKGPILIRSKNVLVGRLDLKDVVHIPEEVHSSMKSSRVSAKDCLLNITGASIGRSAVVPKNIGEANVNQHVCIVRPSPRLLSDYLCQFFNSSLGQLMINTQSKFS